MKILPITAKELKEGKRLNLETLNKEDDLRTAEIMYSDHISRFVIYFNGVITYSSKTFKSLLSGIERLNANYPLDFDNKVISIGALD